jgi:5-methylcytosine-specific restriction endonuclease McrA
MGTNYYERRNRYSDEILIACYLKYESQVKAAKELECSRETVARAVRRAGIALNGRRNGWSHKGNGGGGSPRKITDEELIAESKTMTREEIAIKHRMNVCNIDRKLHRLGISCVKAAPKMRGAVGKGGNYRSRAMAFGVQYEPHVTLKKIMKRDNGICKLCGKPVDVRDRKGGGAGYYYPTIDHIVPLSKGGGHTMSNVQLAHLICNSRKGADNAEIQTA